jgi:serine/threonine protein phosphatase PrpC
MDARSQALPPFSRTAVPDPGAIDPFALTSLSNAVAHTTPVIRGWRCAAASHAGNRRGVNEDALLARSSAGLWAVADGMGGHLGGGRASAAVIGALDTLRLAGDLADCVDEVEDCLVGVNRQLRSIARTEFGGTVIGSTVVVLLARGTTGVGLWAGDSRLYRLREGNLELLTLDHSPVADLYRRGTVGEAEALASDSHVVTRVVGGRGDLCLDISLFEIAQGDRFILCSDGLYRELAPKALAAGLADGDPAAVASALLAGVLAGAASDNLSFIVLDCETLV